MKFIIFSILLVVVSGDGGTKSCEKDTHFPDHKCMELKECLKLNLPVPLRTDDCTGGDNIICCLWNVDGK